MNQRMYELIIELRKKCFETEEEVRNDLDLSLAEFNGLRVLHEDEKLFATDFSRLMSLSPSRGSRVIEKLIKNGYIEVTQVPNNRRSVHIALSAEGKKMRNKIDTKMDECERRILAALSQEQVNSIRVSLLTLLEVM